MACKQETEMLLSHYRNLLALSEAQLHNLEDLQLDRLEDILLQKHMIMDAIDQMARQGIQFSALANDIQVEIKSLLHRIKALEDASQQRMMETKNGIGAELVHVRQENNFNKKYNQYAQTPQLFDESL
jgi:hypothetical protein